MKQKLLLLCIALFLSVSFYAQVANIPNALEICDDNNDGFAEFNLTVLDLQVLGGQSPTDYTVTYHQTQSEADNGINSLPTPYTNTINPQTIYIRLEDNTTSSFDTTTVTLNVLPVPIATLPSPLIACDFDNDGFADFDLESKVAEILNGESAFLTFHETLFDAEVNNNPVSFFYTNIVANMQTLYGRVDSSTSSCFTIVEMQLIVDDGPDHNTPFDYVICENDGNGTETIVVIDMINLIFDFTNPNLTLNLYESLIDAQSIVNPIFGNYNNISNPQTIYYSLEDFTTGCSIISTFNIEIIDCASDADSDNVSNSVEDIDGDGNFANDDTDMDGIPNYIDDDDDGDNILTIDEDYNNNGDPTDDDTNGNMIPDYLESGVALSVERFNSFSFSLFPNPAKSLVTIRLNLTLDQNLNVNVYDVQGKRVTVSQSFNSETIELDTSKLSSGLYFVQLKSDVNTLVQRLIIE